MPKTIIKKPIVSVLMPAYNSEKYIAESIESILNQTFKDFEFIIINDGSTDNTANIVREYAANDPRIKFIDNKKNQGVAKIRNELLNAANGQYLAYQDSDDISLPHRLKIQVDFLDSHPDISVVGAALECFPKYEKMDWIRNPKLLDFYFGNSVPNPVAMLRKQDIDKYNLKYNETYQTCEDYDFWVRCVRFLKIHNLPNVLLKYRVLDNSLSHNNPNLEKYDKIIRDELINSLTDNEMIKSKLSPKYNQYLFGFIPLFRIKRKRIYLFCFIPFLKLRGMWWNLFGIIPFIKNQGTKK